MDYANLQRRITGTVITSNETNFMAVRDSMVWNELKPNRVPDVIVSVKNEQDIVEAINFARKNKLQVVVHGGGHSWCGLAIRNGGMTIDLSSLNESSINITERTVIIQPSISNQDLAERLAKYDLAFPIGHCPTVKASGYLLNGGMSWNMSQWGPACLSVEAVEFVLANGKKIIANASQYADLFWAARGCGPGMFAVATRFHLKCYPLPKALMTSTYYFSLDRLEEVVTEVTALGWKMPSFVELSIFLIKAPDELMSRCQSSNGKLCMISAVSFANTVKESKAALSMLETDTMTQHCLSKTVNEPSNFEKLSDASGATWPEHHRNLCENQCSKENPVDILMALKSKIMDAPSPKSVIVFCLSTGQHHLLEPYDEIALSMDAQLYGGSWAIWNNKKDDLANMKWHEEVMNILAPFTTYHYIGETDIVQNNARVQRSYTTKKWSRLEKIRRKYDPENLFFGYFGGISP